MTCRFCAGEDLKPVIDLGFAPPSNAYLEAAALSRAEVHLPLRVFICRNCWLAQTEDYVGSEVLFTSDYAYFSSTSTSWLAHAARYCAEITERLTLNTNSFVVELASNDGYLLKNFVTGGIPCLGVEPTAATADAAEKLGVPVLREFFGVRVAASMREEGQLADLVIGNNVYAHVPDINDFTAGIADILKPDGVVTLEFPELLTLIQQGAFDTIYHEHYSYLSLTTVQDIFEQHGLRIWDVESIETHGGSLRVFGCLKDGHHLRSDRVQAFLDKESAAGLFEMQTYEHFASRAVTTKHELLRFLLDCRARGRSVAAYGAAAKGNTLLNYCGVGPDLLPYVCDAAESKQHKFLPGSHIPVLHPSQLADRKPDVIVLLPWNLAAELSATLAYTSEWGAELVVVMPEIATISSV